jgi:hypothetical protein
MLRGSWWKFPHLFIVGCALSAFAQTKTTIQVPLESGESIAVITFDESRHSAEDVKHWVELSEEGSYSEPRVALYSCNSEGTSEYVARFQVAIDETAKLIKELDPSDYPQELSEVVTYLHHLQSFWLWENEQELQFLSVGSPPETKWEDLDTGHRCNWTVNKLRRAKSRVLKCKAVLFDWNSCLNKAVQDRLGPYPKKSWESFIRSDGLQVQMLSTEAD